MKQHVAKFLLKTLPLSFALLSPMMSGAQTYPDKNIKILQGFAPGGNADAIARAVGSEISKGLGQAVVVEAQAGAGGTIAAGTVSKSKPSSSANGSISCCGVLKKP